jgi:hypothetical protein
MALLGSGTLTAHLVWVWLDKRYRTRKTLESKRTDSAGIAARAEDSEHRVIPAFFVPSTPTSNYALLRYDLGLLSEIKIIAAPNTIIAHHVADEISIRVADQSRVTDEVFIGTTVTQVGDVTWIMEPGQPLTRQSGPESRTSALTAAGTLALVA